MALTVEQQRRTSREFVDEVLAGQVCGFTKAELRAAAAAVDQWLSDNAVAFNQALPPAFRSGDTAGQKAGLLILVARRRFGG